MQSYGFILKQPKFFTAFLVAQVNSYVYQCGIMDTGIYLCDQKSSEKLWLFQNKAVTLHI